eukprot:1669665-Ditylum_brightwellii.AAC.1
MEDPEMIESFLNHPPLQAMRNPIMILNIQQHQFKDLQLNNMRRQDPQRFPVNEIEGRPLICYREHMNDPVDLWCIALPSKLVVPVIVWYHHVLGHRGINRLYDTINARFKAPALRKQCEAYQCGDCQRNKVFGAGFGQLLARHAALMPWSENAVDLVGPWRINIGGQDA